MRIIKLSEFLSPSAAYPFTSATGALRGPFGFLGEPVMTKTSTKGSASAADSAAAVLIVLGFDEQQKPRGARFVGAKPDLVAKAAQLMDLKVYKAMSPDVAAIAKKLPVGRLYANGRGFV